MILEFTSQAIEWRGPAPFVFVPVPAAESEAIKCLSARLTYGWGCIPAMVTVGETRYKTSLFPREGRYLVPLKMAVQKAEGVGLDSVVAMRLELEF